MSGNGGVSGLSVVSKISAILLTVAENDLITLTELAAQSGLPLSTVHRLASEMAAWGVLERDDKGQFRVGSRLMTSLAPVVGSGPAAAATSWSKLRALVAPVLEDLFRVTGAQVRAGVLDGSEVAYVEKASRHSPVTAFAAAARLPAHATALGKTLLAFAPSSVVDLVVARGLDRYTSSTVVRQDQLRLVLRYVRSKRIAVADGELDEEWTGMAAPVCGAGGTVVAALELRIPDAVTAPSDSRPLLALATACLSRELVSHQVGSPGAGLLEHSEPPSWRGLDAGWTWKDQERRPVAVDRPVPLRIPRRR